MKLLKKLESIGIIIKVDEKVTDILLSNQRNKILENVAVHILNKVCPHCQNIIVIQPLMIHDSETTHCSKCGEWLAHKNQLSGMPLS